MYTRQSHERAQDTRTHSHSTLRQPSGCVQLGRTLARLTRPRGESSAATNRHRARHRALPSDARSTSSTRARGAADGDGAATSHRQAAARSSTAQLQDDVLARARRGAASLRKCNLPTERGALGLADRMRRQRRSGGSRRRHRGRTAPHARGPSAACLCAPLQQERVVADAQNGQ